MPLNIFDVQDSYQVGEAQSKEWLAQFQEDYLMPIRRMKLIMWWRTLPREQKEYIRLTMPKEYEELEKRYGGVNAKDNHQIR